MWPSTTSGLANVASNEVPLWFVLVVTLLMVLTEIGVPAATTYFFGGGGGGGLTGLGSGAGGGGAAADGVAAGVVAGCVAGVAAGAGVSAGAVAAGGWVVEVCFRFRAARRQRDHGNQRND